MRLEEKKFNQHIKERYLRKLGHASDNIVKKRKAQGAAEELKKRRLETALFMALEWQRQLQG